MNDWFPVAEGRPITVKDAWNILENNKDDLSPVWLKENYAVSKFAVNLGPGQSMSKTGHFFNLVRAAWDKPCPTINKSHGQSLSMAGLLHPIELRRPTIREIKRIGSFPDSFDFIGDFAAQWARIGNSVPPLFMRSIARNIKSMLQTGQPYRPNGGSGFRQIDYPAILAEAWQQHLAPKAEDAPTVISTFAGCGGSSLGYSMAGFRELLAVEWDDNAVETFKLNFPDVPVYHGDIAKLSVDECLEMTGLEPGQLDVLDGSPPCQGFSTAGKRNFNDDRNQLFREYVRLLRGLQPKVFVMENVSGMVKGKMKLIFAEILRELKASGYKVSARLLNAMYFQVPQSRERMIFVGVREDLSIESSHPKAMMQPVTVRNAIYDLRHEEGDLAFNPDTRTAMIMRALPAGKHDPKHHSHVKLTYDLPSRTLLKDFLGYFHFWHPEQWRPLTLKEWTRLGSFPDDYQWTDKKNACQRIGNSVPPLLMRSIAQHIRAAILDATNAQPVRVEA